MSRDATTASPETSLITLLQSPFLRTDFGVFTRRERERQGDDQLGQGLMGAENPRTRQIGGLGLLGIGRHEDDLNA